MYSIVEKLQITIQVGGFLRVLLFPPLSEILLKAIFVLTP
jgi:hypothetical protein